MGVRLFFRHRVAEVTGLALIGGGLLLALAFASWSATDPSLNHATGNLVSNWLGPNGAIAADLFYQVLGLASFALIPWSLIWGWRFITHTPIDHPRRRIVTGVLGLAGLALVASLFPAEGIWPLAVGFGGLVGDALTYFTASNLGLLIGTNPAHVLVGSIALIITIFALGYASDISIDQVSEFRWRLMDLYYGWAEARAERREAAYANVDDEPSRLARIWYGTTDGISYVVGGILARFSRDDEEDEWEEEAPVRRIEPSLSARRRTPATSARDQYDEDDEDEDETGNARNVPVRRSNKRVKPGKRAEAERQPMLDILPAEDFDLPALNILSSIKKQAADESLSDEALQQNARMLEGVLDDFGIRGEIINVRPGPVVTLYELEPAPGIKSSRVIALADDIARSMSAISARVAVVPGRNAIGIELPNARREMVGLREILSSSEYEDNSSSLPLALGKNIGGEPIIADLARMPHLLIAGTTGSGKSVGINTMILSLLYRMRPDQCKMIMIDPKMLELSIYDGIPHLLAPVVTDPKKAIVALKWVVKEMEERYRKMSKVGVRNIDGFNLRMAEAIENDETIVRTVQTGFDRDTGKAIYEEEELALERMPYIVVIVDEMADLMMVAGKEIEGAIQRLAQMARAAGIHMITATQRPSVDVITGTIKANFPTRISFQVTSKIDSRTILGEQGAEQLLGQGDMLYMAGGGRISRVHGPFVSDQEVEKVVRFLKKQGVPEYLDAVTEDTEEEAGDSSSFGGSSSGDDLYDEAVAIVGRDKRASTSYIQRKLQIGYNRAARIIEQMEEEGVVSAPNHAGKREVMIGEPGEGVRY
ncbi:MAG: DNA translocase FtsK 4TM domain-containing protein [Parvibaculum sp.]